jgi:predicted regulator of Ras-like GTPase activity (Roadblock/LC7/MglB family)
LSLFRTLPMSANRLPRVEPGCVWYTACTEHDMAKSDESLRSTRLVFYKEDIEVIGKSLNTFLKNANARCVLLVDKDGHMVTKEGESSTYDMDTISALVAGSFAVIFDDRTTLGMVRLYASQVSSKLAKVFEEIAGRKSEKEKISQDFGQAAKGKLDDIFGN